VDLGHDSTGFTFCHPIRNLGMAKREGYRQDTKRLQGLAASQKEDRD
jgi:hypothetical protein